MGQMTKNHVFRENSAPPVANNSRHPITCFRTQKPTNPAYFDANQTLLSRVRIKFCSFLTSKSSLTPKSQRCDIAARRARARVKILRPRDQFLEIFE